MHIHPPSDMHIDHRTVSRKTPGDGKLEISDRAASRLAHMGPGITVEWNGTTAPATLSSFTCTCGKAGGPHDHYFLETVLFTTLPVGADVDLILRDEVLHVAVTPSD